MNSVDVLNDDSCIGMNLEVLMKTLEFEVKVG